MRADALAALAGVDLILHAGDVGGRAVIDALEGIAPVRAVRGNTDDPHDPNLESRVDVELGGYRIHVSHGHELGSPTPERLAAAYDADIIVFGHTHKAVVERVGGALVVNPGAAGSPRFGGGLSVARLALTPGEPRVDLLTLV